MMRAGAVAMAVLAGPAQAADYYFCWIGANDYTMTGAMSVVHSAINKPIITAPDVTNFQITGFHQGFPIGSWSLANRAPTDTWVLNFDPATNSFLPGDASPLGYTQGWNADGTATDCGPGGFGFNSGNYAQDFCLNGKWIEESGIAPETVFVVGQSPLDASCNFYPPTS
ncbi:hypothetical protein [Yoonia sediminilitoris]|uniref:Uncharacterized protein n=1 Tax=Yoonia sediminilitoris TaxID=1286148 RepID=A0A2T6KIN9_9RHOB|nr:hypothetical protein [Yoonia sediminilitoris]PUB15568.1 hypothetical protein C8N45_104188 [Yoonia sediminilitoris]RCW96177.1 hypothetical protein DFP92_104187 [Yoonia sediminilitoris]